MADDRLRCGRSESTAVTRADKVMFRPLAISFPVPECIFETNARLVASDHDRALDDQRFHEDPPQSSPDLDQNISFLGRDARPNASAQPWTRTSQWMPMLQRGVFLGAPTPNQTLDS